MDSKKILFPAFILVALIQLIVPGLMILDQEFVLGNGKEFKFKTVPVDPNDPFRGKYVILQFEANAVPVDPSEAWWPPGEFVFVSLQADSEGFAQIRSVSRTPPTEAPDFVKATVSHVTSGSTAELVINYPFNRFYMEEFKAGPAEEAFRQSMSDTNKVAYALVRVKKGKAVLKDVLIDGVSLREIGKGAPQ